MGFCPDHAITLNPYARLRSGGWLMGERNMKIVDVARETGLNRNTVTLLYRETTQRIDLDALDKLCRLFECEWVIFWNFRRKSENRNENSGEARYFCSSETAFQGE